MSADAVTSLAFVAAGVVVALHGARGWREDRRRGVLRLQLAALTALVGLGSWVQHGPGPSWNPVVHDPPLAALLCFVATDAVADLRGGVLRMWWWLGPGLVCVLLAATVPPASAAWQGAAAVVAVAVTLVRAVRRPDLRPWLLSAMSVLGVGALIGSLGAPGAPLSSATVLPEPHAVWHVLAALAVCLLVPTIGRSAERGS